MKASFIRTIWIIIASLFSTGLFCLKIIWCGRNNKINRDLTGKQVLSWANNILDLVRAKCEVINPNNIEPQEGVPTIILCNHSSLYDIPISFLVFPKHPIRMLAKKELSKIPLMGKAMQRAESPIIDRKNRKQAIKDLQAIKKLLQSGIVMWIAPEGTRSRDGKLAAFKKGPFITAIQTKANIIPIGIRGAFDILPAKTFRFTIGQKIQVHVGQPISAASYSLDNKDELINKTHAEMLKLVGE